jgi:ABC-2 type transport system permease protein
LSLLRVGRVAAGHAAATDGHRPGGRSLGIGIVALAPNILVGVLAFSGEYGTGLIRATLAVVPSRLPVLWAKLIVLAGLILPVTLLCAVADFFATTALNSARGVRRSR